MPFEIDSTSETSVPKLDKGKGKATELEGRYATQLYGLYSLRSLDVVEGPQGASGDRRSVLALTCFVDSVMDISTAARLYSRFRGSAKLIDDSEKFQASAVNSTLPTQYIDIADQNINLVRILPGCVS